MVAQSQAAAFTDFNALAQLKSRASRSDQSATREAARQFEALFLQMMLKSMRNAGSALAESRDRTYEEMFDQQIALEMSRRDSVGIADLLLRQVDMQEAGGASNTRADGTPAVQTHAARGLSSRRRADFHPGDPQQFVAQIWPLARETASKLGVDPRAIVAQAVLETGWGERLIRDGRGISGNNLFGIKADQRWNGERIAVSTLEYEGDRFVPRTEQFRAYPTLAEGFDGYAEFLAQEVRYARALERGANAGEFARELKNAGYATDPDYAEKIDRILASDMFAKFLPPVDSE